ncbi:MAG TPA: zinc ribbon domain-containing protein, partial [Candidatus Eremiobacteraeota bacterium]|nr:zinc ribbon domain-containing protein [Candidatus Eremiobacteraeota bacterium]
MIKKKRKKKKKVEKTIDNIKVNSIEKSIDEKQDNKDISSVTEKQDKVKELEEKVVALQATIESLVSYPSGAPVITHKNCPSCNSLNRIKAKFCKVCGYNLLLDVPDIETAIPHSITKKISDDKQQEAFKMVVCSECKSENRETAKFCKSCGNNLKITLIACFKCNTENRSNAKFCKVCGEKVLIEGSKKEILKVERAVKDISPTEASLKEEIKEKVIINKGESAVTPEQSLPSQNKELLLRTLAKPEISFEDLEEITDLDTSDSCLLMLSDNELIRDDKNSKALERHDIEIEELTLQKLKEQSIEDIQDIEED